MGKIIVCLNGEKKHVQASSIADLLSTLQLKQTHVIVEVNETIINKKKYATTVINHNDVIEIIRYIGGGENSLSFLNLSPIN